jgi:hypothetical protein
MIANRCCISLWLSEVTLAEDFVIEQQETWRLNQKRE